MRAGALRHRVTIQQKVITTDAEYGGPAIAWTDLGDTWASVEPLSGRELISAQANHNEINTRIRMRYRPDINSAMRILFGGVAYSISSILDLQLRHRELEIMATAGMAEGEGVAVSYTDILFFWNAENTLTAEKGGLTGNNSGAVFSTTSKVGTYSIAHDSRYDYVDFAITSSQFNPANGQIGFWYQTSNGYQTGSGNYLVTANYSTTDLMRLSINNVNGIKLTWTGNSTTSTAEYTSTAMSLNTWYYITAKWHPGDAGNDLVLTIYNADGSVFGSGSAANITAMANNPTLLRFGSSSGDAVIWNIDHFTVSSDITRDMWAIQSATSF